MNLEKKKSGEFVVLKPLDKNLDATNSAEFKGRVLDLIQQGNNFFILNLSAVDFVDSSGLGAMISILKTLTLNNGHLVLCELKNPVQNLLNVTRLTNVFKICSTESEGLESLTTLKNPL